MVTKDRQTWQKTDFVLFLFKRTEKKKTSYKVTVFHPQTTEDLDFLRTTSYACTKRSHLSLHEAFFKSVYIFDGSSVFFLVT